MEGSASRRFAKTASDCALRNKSLKAIHAKLPKRQRIELVVQWQVDAQPVPPADHQLAPSDEGVLLLGDQPPGEALSPRHDLPCIQMALASRVTV